MKFHEAIAALKKGKAHKFTGVGESANNSLYIYTMIQNEEKEIKVYRTMILPGGKKETAEHMDCQELLTVDFLPVYFESDYRTALAYVSAHENVDFYFLTVDDEHGIYIQGTFTEIMEKLLDIYREKPSEYARALMKSVWFSTDGNRKTKKRKKK